MSAPKARLVLSVQQSGPDDVTLNLKDKETGVVSTVSLEDTPRTDLQRAFGVALKSPTCGNCNNIDTRTADPDALRLAIRHALSAHHAGYYTWTRKTDTPPEPEPAPTCAHPACPLPGDHHAGYCGSHTWTCPDCDVRFHDYAAFNIHRDESHRAPEPESAHDYTPQPAPVPAPDTSGAVDAFAAMVSDIVRRTMADTPQGIDETAVRAIVDDATSELRAPNVIQVHLPDRAPRELPGRQHAAFPRVLALANLRLHVFLVGPPGTGKTTLASQVADALDLNYGAISCYPTMPASQLWGFRNATGDYVRTEWRERYEHGGVFLFDEIDNGHPGILAALNQALANGECAFPDGMVKRHPDLVIIAGGNTYGTGATRQFVGRTAMDAATRDRFVTVTVDIDESLESELAHAEHADRVQVDLWLTRVRRYRHNIDTHGLQVVASPRASISGARMLSAGISADDAAEMLILGSLTDDQRAKVAQ